MFNCILMCLLVSNILQSLWKIAHIAQNGLLRTGPILHLGTMVSSAVTLLSKSAALGVYYPPVESHYSQETHQHPLEASRTISFTAKHRSSLQKILTNVVKLNGAIGFTLPSKSQA